MSDSEAALTDMMVGYWANFARSGNPNGAGLPDWPDQTGDNWMHFSANTDRPIAQVETGLRTDKIDSLSEGLTVKLDALAAAEGLTE